MLRRNFPEAGIDELCSIWLRQTTSLHHKSDFFVHRTMYSFTSFERVSKLLGGLLKPWAAKL